LETRPARVSFRVRKDVIIAGPTACGKSTLAVELAMALRAAGTLTEIVSADAYQIYRGMDIGTGKMTAREQRGVAHHLIDIVEPTERFTVADWLARARAVIADIRMRGGVAVVVGGTHLYVKALIDGLFEGPPGNEALRERLRARGLVELRRELERVDPRAAARIHPNDLRRTVRALEVYELTGKPLGEQQRQWDRGVANEFRLVILKRPVDELNRRINARVREMFERGLVEEARTLWEGGRLGAQAREALGYKQLIEHFEARTTLEEAMERTKIETRRFAKNQRTWLRRLSTTPGVIVLDATSLPPEQWLGAMLKDLQGGET
jgi:tRNA dimethylallyltransferase